MIRHASALLCLITVTVVATAAETQLPLSGQSTVVQVCCCQSDCGGRCDVACGDGCGARYPLGSCLPSCGEDCCLGDPCSLFGQYCGYSIGGWLQAGYSSKALPLFNSLADELQMQQAWVYGEKAVDGSCGLDLGGRIDYLYGTDGPDTQAFGINNRHWDNPWDNGANYGHAIPQLYARAAYGDLTITAGKFFTLIGWEVVAAPDNFFYSHAYTMYNSEPFTHTGGYATYSISDCWQMYGGYVLGWDSGFEDNGDAWLGGSDYQFNEFINIHSRSTAGRFADNAGGDERGYMGSLVVDVTLTDSVQWIVQSDVLSTENAIGQTVRETYGLNQYLIKTINDCLAYGMRLEWWTFDANSQGYYGAAAPANLAATATGAFDVYALTLGLNYKPHANLVIRPEIRWDWVTGGDRSFLNTADLILLENNDANQTTFGVDTILLY